MINDLHLETDHRGSFVLLRFIVPMGRTSGAFCIVEDEEGNALTLIVYYQGQDRAAEDLLPQGGVFIVKEPYLTQLEDENSGIRVIMLPIYHLSMGNPLIPAAWRQTSRNDRANVEEMKLKGHEYFLKGKYYAAIDRYESSKAQWWSLTWWIVIAKSSIVIPPTKSSAPLNSIGLLRSSRLTSWILPCLIYIRLLAGQSRWK